jgi:hypothetical protein
MSDGTSFTRSLPLSYEQVGHRIQRIVAAPGVQKVQAVTVSRLDGEPPALWERVLADIEATDGVVMERLPDGAVRIGWKKYIDG